LILNILAFGILTLAILAFAILNFDIESQRRLPACEKLSASDLPAKMCEQSDKQVNPIILKNSEVFATYRQIAT
jgi:hypothetical protein